MPVEPRENERVHHFHDLAERREEIAEIDRALGWLGKGHAGLLVIEGDAGSGRTSVLNQVVTRARQRGIRILSAAGSVSEQDTTLALGGQLIGEMPVPRRVLPHSPRGNTAFCAMYRRLAERCSAGPTVIAVDDLHLFDDLSLRWLTYVSRRLRTLPALLAVTVCTDAETSPTDATFTAELRNRLDAVTLLPAPLSKDAVAVLLGKIASRPVPEPVVAVCVELTGGNPLLLAELVRTLTQENIDPSLTTPGLLAKISPPGVAQYVLSRIAHLPAAAKQVAYALAVLGPSTEVDVIAAICSMTEPAVHDTLLAFNQLGIIRSVPPAQYVHPLIRNALYADMGSGERRRYHQAAATLLYQRRGAAPDVARHLLAASSKADAQTVEMLYQVVVDLIDAGELALAADCLRQALHGSIPPDYRGLLTLTLGEVLEIHDPEAAVDHLRYAAAVVRHPRQISQAQLALGRAMASCGQVPEAVAVLRGCVDDLTEKESGLRERVHAVQLVLSLLHGETVGAATIALSRVTASSEGNALSVPRAIRATWSGVDRDRTVGRMRGILEDSPANSTRFVEHTAALLTLVHADRSDLAAKYLNGIAENTLCTAEFLGLRASVALVNGDVSQSERHARKAVELVASGAGRPLLLDHRAVLAGALCELGEQAEAASIIDGIGAGWDLPDEWQVNHLLETRGRLRLAAGELHAGLADLLECGSRLRRWGVSNPLVNGWRCTAAIALSQVGEQRRAVALAEEQLHDARRWGAPRAIGLALHARGLIEKDPQARAESLGMAVDQLRKSPAVLDLARSMLDLGEAMIDRNDLQPAREQVREGLAVAQRCGAKALAVRAHEVLLRSGAKPRRRAQFGRDALTASELRTALMAAEGRTNRQIAKELFVTQRTIELHLTNAYRKLHIRNRADLAASLNDNVVAEAH